MKTIYVTHCSREKDAELEKSGALATPDKLYTSPEFQRFIRSCDKNGYEWAVFSDNYGVIFPQQSIGWYNKPPSEVTEKEFAGLLESFIDRLRGYDEIWFYLRQEESHPLFERVLRLSRAAGLQIREFTEENITN